MIDLYFCCIYVNNQTKCNEINLFGKPISFIMTLFGKNGGDYREKNVVSMENYNTTFVEYYILALFTVTKVLLFICELEWIPNSFISNTIWSQLSKLAFWVFFPPFWLVITKK